MLVLPGEKIVSEPTFWFSWYDHPYTSILWLASYSKNYKAGSTFEEAMRENKADILILDNRTDQFISDEPFKDIYDETFRIPQKDLDAFIKNRANLIYEYRDDYLGQVRVYRIHWQ